MKNNNIIIYLEKTIRKINTYIENKSKKNIYKKLKVISAFLG